MLTFVLFFSFWFVSSSELHCSSNVLDFFSCILADGFDGIFGFEIRDLFGSDLVLLRLFGRALTADDFDFCCGAMNDEEDEEEEEGVEEVEVEVEVEKEEEEVEKEGEGEEDEVGDGE